ncbi:MAG: hypothetical protein NC340_00800 [Ruminococcus flavefaciens]|nr:hypothetical protein [Ruminococcus flavefaciens]MCM1228650.1 hypothetical protein [Ruminococcus flavefaciens]
MKRKLSAFLGFILCAGILTSCASKEANENSDRIAEALKQSNIYSEEITVTACSDIFTANDERDEQSPFMLLEPSDYVSEYCYIEIEEDDSTQVYVLSVGDKNTGAAHTYDNMITISTLYLSDTVSLLDSSDIEEIIRENSSEYTVTPGDNVNVKRINKAIAE